MWLNFTMMIKHLKKMQWKLCKLNLAFYFTYVHNIHQFSKIINSKRKKKKVYTQGNKKTVSQSLHPRARSLSPYIWFPRDLWSFEVLKISEYNLYFAIFWNYWWYWVFLWYKLPFPFDSKANIWSILEIASYPFPLYLLADSLKMTNKKTN